MKLLLAAWVGLALLVPAANAWNSLAHRAVVELVWRQMDQTEQGAVSALLRPHPHYAAILTADVPEGVSTN